METSLPLFDRTGQEKIKIMSSGKSQTQKRKILDQDVAENLQLHMNQKRRKRDGVDYRMM